MVDLSFLKEFTKGNVKKMKRYISLYLSIAPDTFEKMNQNIQDQNWEQLRIHAHSLKPQADYMGIPELKSALIDIENGVKNKKNSMLPELYEKAHQIHLQSEKSLKGLVDNLE